MESSQAQSIFIGKLKNMAPCHVYNYHSTGYDGINIQSVIINDQNYFCYNCLQFSPVTLLIQMIMVATFEQKCRKHNCHRSPLISEVLRCGLWKAGSLTPTPPPYTIF